MNKEQAADTPRFHDLEAPEPESGGGVEIAHVLFCDIVGYSLLPIDEQKRMMQTLQEVVRQTEDYRRAESRGQLVRLPAGDGMALAFLHDAVAPARCAVAIARRLKQHPEIRLRMGAHSGPVFLSTDINAQRNVVGSGINMAQRVMDSGDGGHILVSRNVAEVLSQISQWRELLHDLGEREVKHGVRLHLFNLYTEEVGNSARPAKLRAESAGRFGHYTVTTKLGAGAMGEVWLAEDTRLGRKVAIKLLPAELTKDDERVRRFEQEAKAVSALNHPHIITIHETGETEAGRFIVMELVQGRTLSALEAPCPPELLLSLGVQTAKALGAAHAAGVTHRDIKPDNIMVRDDGYVKMLDFGLARLRSAAESDPEVATLAQQTSPGTVVGTVAYMSPEQARGEAVGHPSDIFALGIVLYELAAGRHPFKADTMVGYLHAITSKTPPPPAGLNPEIPAALESLILRMLAKDASRRPTAGEVARQLQEIERKGFAESWRRSASENDSIGGLTGGVAPADLRSAKDLPIGTENFGGKSDIQAEPGRSRGSDAQAAPIGSGEKAAAQDDAEKSAAGTRGVSNSSRPDRAPTRIKNHKLAPAVVVLILAAIISAIGYSGYFARNNAGQIESIAVLPFVNGSGNADVEYLSDGMTETLISGLSNLPNLSVKPRSSVFRYKGTETNLQTIGKELHVQAILNGRVVQRGNGIALHIELIDAPQEKVLWATDYNRQMKDLVALQSEVARDVSTNLRTKFSGPDVAKVTRTYTADSEAYQAYLKGKYNTNKYTKDGFDEGIKNFNQAIAADPNFSLAYSGLAYNYINQDDWYMAPSESIPRAKEAASKALKLDETNAEAHTVLAISAHWYDWDWATAEREFKRSIELNPKNAESYTYYSWLLSSMGRHEESLAMARAGLQLEPLASGSNYSVASVLFFAHRWDAAIAQLNEAIKLDPNYWFTRSYLGRSLMQKGRIPEAFNEFNAALQVDSSQSENSAGIGYAYAVTNQKAEAQKIIDRLIKQPSGKSYFSPYNIAVIYAGLGDKEQAFSWLEKAYLDRSFYLAVYFPTDERLETLRSDPRFKNLLKRVGLPE